jgi:hypothetical protein
MMSSRKVAVSSSQRGWHCAVFRISRERSRSLQFAAPTGIQGSTADLTEPRARKFSSIVLAGISPRGHEGFPEPPEGIQDRIGDAPASAAAPPTSVKSCWYSLND